MIINTSSTKILPKMDALIVEICQEKKSSRSDFFLQAVLKALHFPYTGSQGVARMDFKRAGVGKSMFVKPRYRTIGARISPEIKAEIRVICKRYTITESQFYRWALEMEIVCCRQQRTAKKIVAKKFEHRIVVIPRLRNPVHEFIDKLQKDSMDNFRKAHQISQFFGLTLALLAGNARK